MALHPGRMVEVTRAPALVVDLWSGLLTVLYVSAIGKIRYESPQMRTHIFFFIWAMCLFTTIGARFFAVNKQRTFCELTAAGPLLRLLGNIIPTVFFGANFPRYIMVGVWSIRPTMLLLVVFVQCLFLLLQRSSVQHHTVVVCCVHQHFR